ncbi:MAG: hypothetical protein H6833_10825 [Planctomycetes bacterium]|nr:hypothetical protein [Planctomycetota bacterium]
MKPIAPRFALTCTFLTALATAQYNPSPEAPYTFDGTPIVIPPRYDFHGSFHGGLHLGGDTLAGSIYDTQAPMAPRRVPFFWTPAGGFVDCSATVDAGVPGGSYESCDVYDINDVGVVCGTVSYQNTSGQRVQAPYTFDTRTGTFLRLLDAGTYLSGGAVRINDRGEALISTSRGLRVWRNGVLYTTGGGPWTFRNYTLLDDGTVVGLGVQGFSGPERIYRWSFPGTAVDVTPTPLGTGSLSHTTRVSANNDGWLLVENELFDPAGNLVGGGPVENRITDDATLYTDPARHAGLPHGVVWNGEIVGLAGCIQDTRVETFEARVKDNQGNFAAIDVSRPVDHRYAGQPVDGIYFKRRMNLAPAINFSGSAVTPGQIELERAVTAPGTLRLDVHGQPNAFLVLMIGATSGGQMIPPFPLLTGAMSATGNFNQSFPMSSNYAGPSFHLTAYTVMPGPTLQIGVSATRTFHVQ